MVVKTKKKKIKKDEKKVLTYEKRNDIMFKLTREGQQKTKRTLIIEQ